MSLKQKLEFLLLSLTLTASQRREVAALTACVYAAAAAPRPRRWWIIGAGMRLDASLR
ncbi:MAG: hypothetical protein RBT75_16055 [Anaerolineae bacterium]|nr:hypothetical protein [Anaerolineae bacterium]